MSAFVTGEVVTVSTVAVGLTAATYLHAMSAVIQVQDQPIRWRIDGTAPTSSVGFVAGEGAEIFLDCYNEIVNFKAIRGTADGDATLQVTYRK